MKKRYLFLLLIFTYLYNFNCNAQNLEAKYDSFQEELKPLEKINAKAVFDVNQTDKIISFDKNWLE